MDKQTTLGFVLIAAVLMVWMWWTAPKPSPNTKPVTTQEQYKKDSVIQPSNKSVAEKTTPVEETTKKDSVGKYFSASSNGIEKIITIETDNYIAEFSTKGGIIKKWTLKKYTSNVQYEDGRIEKFPVQLVDYSKGDFSLLFTTSDGKLINTRNLFFDVQTQFGNTITLSKDDEQTIDFVLQGSSGKIVKSLHFKNGTYGFDADIKFLGLHDAIANYEYQIVWENGLRYAEDNSVDESKEAKAFSFAGGEVSEVDAATQEEVPTSNTSGVTEWVATRTKYFAVAILSDDKKANGAYLEGHHIAAPNNGAVERYAVALKMPFKNTDEEISKISVFLGPLDFSIIKSYDRSLDKIMSLGWSWIRPVTVYVFIPLFKFLHLFIANYGIVIIIFSIIIKLALHPLTKSSMNSMKRMQKLQPLMEEIREKYKNDANTMNMQIMKLYKDYGVNPAGGCLPMLLQLPILYALYSLFSGSIELRQANFVWWITDLATPDVMVRFPFTVPFIGNFISGLTLLMGITMFVQQKMTVTDPRQKQMVWMMPIMMTIIFNHLPSGLNLYYFVFNVLGIAQQYYINKHHDNTPLQKIPASKQKSGLMERLQKKLPQLPKQK